MDFAQRAQQLRETIVRDRRWIHRHPELSYHEHETTAYLVCRLTRMGIPVQTFGDYTGCIATIQGGQPGRTVLLRADIDALPIQEETGLDFASVHPGVMHACGHDCHAAMLLGAARLLWEGRQELHGTVKLLFQAAEEVFIGSHYYWDRGCLSDVDAAMGMHVWPTAPSGKLVVQDGPMMASCDTFTITVRGVSAHGSRPDAGRDAIVAASAIICNMQTVVSRCASPLEPLVVSVCTVHAGTEFNIITDTAVLEGTVRALSGQARQMAEPAMRRIVRDTAAAMGCTAEVDWRPLESPVCNENAALNEIARSAARKLFGDGVLYRVQPAMGSEDFSYLMEKIPNSLFLFLGCYDEAQGCVHPIHNGKFQINEDILPIGAAQYAQFAADYLEQSGGEGQ